METDSITTSCCTLRPTCAHDFMPEASVDFMSEIRRLASFRDWESDLPLTISKGHLAKTGLSYDRNEQKLKCEACAFEFDLNEQNIDPTEQHLKQNPECELALVRNEIFPPLSKSISPFSKKTSQYKYFQTIFRTVAKKDNIECFRDRTR